MLNDWISHKDLMKRQFTINAGTEHCELLTFSINDLSRMKNEFLEAYESMFSDSYQRLYRTLRIKLRAMKHCQQILDGEVKRVLQTNLRASLFNKNSNVPKAKLDPTKI